jgi:hypothetical protein
MTPTGLKKRLNKIEKKLRYRNMSSEEILKSLPVIPNETGMQALLRACDYLTLAELVDLSSRDYGEKSGGGK